MKNDLPSFLNEKGKAVYRTLASRVADLSPDHVHGLQLIAYQCQRASVTSASDEADAELALLCAEYNLSRSKSA